MHYKERLHFIATETNTKLSIYVVTPSCLKTAAFAAYNLLLPMYAVKQMPKARLGGYPANAQNSPPSNIVKSSSRQSSRSSRCSLTAPACAQQHSILRRIAADHNHILPESISSATPTGLSSDSDAMESFNEIPRV